MNEVTQREGGNSGKIARLYIYKNLMGNQPHDLMKRREPHAK